MLTIHKRLPKHRRFEYQPRFHDPSKDEAVKRQIRIRRANPATFRKTKQPQFIAVGLGLVGALYLFINGDEIFGRAVEGLSLLFGG